MMKRVIIAFVGGFIIALLLNRGGGGDAPAVVVVHDTVRLVDTIRLTDTVYSMGVVQLEAVRCSTIKLFSLTRAGIKHEYAHTLTYNHGNAVVMRNSGAITIKPLFGMFYGPNGLYPMPGLEIARQGFSVGGFFRDRSRWGVFVGWSIRF